MNLFFSIEFPIVHFGLFLTPLQYLHVHLKLYLSGGGIVMVTARENASIAGVLLNAGFFLLCNIFGHV